MAKKLRLAIAGVGLVGKRHERAISQIDRAELTVIIDPQPHAKEYAKQHNILYFSDLEQAIEETPFDGVVLSTPTPLHVEQARFCFAKKIPILIEKPIAVSVADAQDMVREAQLNAVPILVGHHRRHNPIIRSAHEQINAGAVGEIRAVHVNCWFYKPDHYFDIAPWRKKKGAGPISVNLVHDVDLIRYLCGEVVLVQAQATPSKRCFENEDVAGALLRFENGAIATITVSDSIAAPWSWELTSGEYPIYPKTLESCYQIGGSKGSLSIPDLRLWQHGSDEPDWWSPIMAKNTPQEASDPLVNQMHHFCDVIEKKVEPIVSGWEGLRTLQVVEAIQKSAETGEAIRVHTLDAALQIHM